jgi:hypothetical protein
MALSAIAHQRRALLHELGIGRPAPDDRFRFGAHLGKQSVRHCGIEAAEANKPPAHDLVRDRRAQQTNCRAHARIGGNEHAAYPELVGDACGMQRRAPPNAIRYAGAGPPLSMACTRAAFAMFSSTISLMPSAPCSVESFSAVPMCSEMARVALATSSHGTA